MYIDGHERDDVVRYRKEFLGQIMHRSRNMCSVEWTEMDLEVVPDLLPDEKLLI